MNKILFLLLLLSSYSNALILNLLCKPGDFKDFLFNVEYSGSVYSIGKVIHNDDKEFYSLRIVCLDGLNTFSIGNSSLHALAFSMNSRHNFRIQDIDSIVDFGYDFTLIPSVTTYEEITDDNCYDRCFVTLVFQYPANEADNIDKLMAFLEKSYNPKCINCDREKRCFRYENNKELFEAVFRHPTSEEDNINKLIAFLEKFYNPKCINCNREKRCFRYENNKELFEAVFIYDVDSYKRILTSMTLQGKYQYKHRLVGLAMREATLLKEKSHIRVQSHSNKKQFVEFALDSSYLNRLGQPSLKTCHANYKDDNDKDFICLHLRSHIGDEIVLFPRMTYDDAKTKKQTMSHRGDSHKSLQNKCHISHQAMVEFYLKTVTNILFLENKLGFNVFKSVDLAITFLEKIGFSVIKVRGDHYCLYNAVVEYANRMGANPEEKLNSTTDFNEIKEKVASHTLCREDVYSFFREYAAILFSEKPDFSDFQKMIAIFAEQEPGPGMWGDENIIRHIVVPFLGKPVIVLDTEHAHNDNQIRGELYNSDGGVLLLNDNEILVKTISDFNGAIFLHEKDHWNVVFPK